MMAAQRQIEELGKPIVIALACFTTAHIKKTGD